jgi:hypothetical protein
MDESRHALSTTLPAAVQRQPALERFVDKNANVLAELAK